MEDERLEPADRFRHERRDVAVAPVLAQEGLRVPQHEQRLVGPRQRRVGGEQRAALGRLHRLQRDALREIRGFGDLGPVRVGAEHPPQRAVRTAQAGASTTSAGVTMSQAPGIDARTTDGRKLKKVAMTTSAGTAPIGAARDGK